MPPGAMSNANPHSDDWLTAPSLLIALGALAQTAEGEYELGPDPYDLDPTSSVNQPWPTARTMWTVHEDARTRDWSPFGEVYANFPYGLDLYQWLARLASHGNGTALLYARTDTRGFHQHVLDKADAVYFFAGRPWFHVPVTGERAPANCGGPLCLALYGKRSVRRARRLLKLGSPYPGMLVPIDRG